MPHLVQAVKVICCEESQHLQYHENNLCLPLTIAVRVNPMPRSPRIRQEFVKAANGIMLIEHLTLVTIPKHNGFRLADHWLVSI